MRTPIQNLFASLALILQICGQADAAQGPLPKFTLQGKALEAKDLQFAPTGELERAALIKMEGRVPNPLGRYYLYYSPHKHAGIGLVYSDSITGPWKEYEGNPVIESTAIPDIRWFETTGRFHMWGHRKNSQTEMWTSVDGLKFQYHSVSVAAKRIGTRNATYTRAYEYPLERHDNRYIMLYSGFIEDRGIRCVWLAHSKDGETWRQETTPLVEPIEGENNDLYGPALFRWEEKNYIVYQDHTGNRGGLIKYVELDQQLSPVGAGGERFTLIAPDPDSPVGNRYRGCEFYREGDTIHMYAGGGNSPRILIHATARVGDDKPAARAPAVPAESRPKPSSPTSKKKKGKPAKSSKDKASAPSLKEKRKESAPPAPAVSLDAILKGVELETIYETAFDEPLRMIREEELLEGMTFAREPGRNVDWVLEGPAETEVKSGRLHIRNDPSGNCVLWNTREFPESFVAEWDFQHHHPQGLAIVFFAARGIDGGSIFAPGLPKRGGAFGNYTRGKIQCYHTSYTATDEDGVPRGTTHLKKDAGDRLKGGKAAAGPGFIDGKTDRPYRLRLAKLKNRILLEVDGKVSFDWTDTGEKGGPPFQGGRIGFRQMRHAIEASYGELKVQRIVEIRQ